MGAVADSKDMLNKISDTTKNGRFTPNTRKNLDEAIQIFMKDKKSSLNIFGDMNSWDVSKITNMSKLFDGYKNFNKDISNWDVSNVTNMSSMFGGCTSFNQDISKWNVSNVTDMKGMFRGCIIFNQDLSRWDVSKVTDFTSMFENCSAFTTLPNDWSINTRARDMEDMFSGTQLVENLENFAGAFMSMYTVFEMAP